MAERHRALDGHGGESLVPDKLGKQGIAADVPLGGNMQ